MDVAIDVMDTAEIFLEHALLKLAVRTGIRAIHRHALVGETGCEFGPLRKLLGGDVVRPENKKKRDGESDHQDQQKDFLVVILLMRSVLVGAAIMLGVFLHERTLKNYFAGRIRIKIFFADAFDDLFNGIFERYGHLGPH